MSDKLSLCLKCGGGLCYESQFETVKSWMCIGCGYQTVSLMKKGSDFQKQQEQTLPELYKDLAFTDIENKVWYPVVLNCPNQGMVFADGPSVKDWKWTAILATKVLESEKENYKKLSTGEYYEYKMDSKTKKGFDRNDFISAAGYLGLFKNE